MKFLKTYWPLLAGVAALLAYSFRDTVRSWFAPPKPVALSTPRGVITIDPKEITMEVLPPSTVASADGGRMMSPAVMAQLGIVAAPRDDYESPPIMVLPPRLSA